MRWVAKKGKKKYEKKPNGKNLTWRPDMYNNKVIQNLEAIFKIDWTVTEACLYAWIWLSTYYDRIEKYPEFSERMERAKQFPYILAKKTLFKSINDENIMIAQKWAIEFLKRRESNYKDKIESKNENTVELLSDEDKNIIDEIINNKW